MRGERGRERGEGERRERERKRREGPTCALFFNNSSITPRSPVCAARLRGVCPLRLYIKEKMIRRG